MKNKGNRLLCLLLALALVLCGLSACGTEGKGKEEETLYPITLKGTEVRVGETTVQALLDEGLQVTWTDENYETVVVDPNAMLDAESYYTGGNVWLSDSIFANISFVTEEEAQLGQAVVARLEFYLYGEEDQSVLEQISFDGVPVTQWTREMAGEKYPDWTGDESMWLHYGLDYKYDLNFDLATGKMTKFTVERSYDVDWTGDE